MPSSKRPRKGQVYVQEELTFDSVVVTEEHLRALHDKIRNSALFDHSTGQPSATITMYFENGKSRKLDDIKDLFSHPNTHPERITRVEYCFEQSDVTARFFINDEAHANWYLCGPVNHLSPVSHMVRQEVKRCHAPRPQPIRFVIINPSLGRWVGTICFLSVGATVCCTLSYIYAYRFGVELDYTLLPNGNNHAMKIQEAIKSGSADEKLNALLASELTWFWNASDMKEMSMAVVRVCFIVIMVCVPTLLMMKHIRTLYPKGIFDIGHEKPRLARLAKQRELWIIGILLSLAVEITAAALMAML